MKPIRPKNKKQWQEAVNAAHTCLLIDSSVQYGLLEVEGLPKGESGINVNRCIQILESGTLIGIKPNN